MVPFVGKAHVGYLPGSGVVGLSKIARLAHGSALALDIEGQL
jgi:GTP cyclohydrolase I